MSDYIDRLPGNEREKIRKRLRSPEAYERLRENVKGPEDLEREMKKSEQLAEVHLLLETDPTTGETLRSALRQDISEQGIEQILETDRLSQEAKAAIEQGKFRVSVDAHPSTNEDALVVVTEGNVQETVPVKLTFSERYAGALLRHV